MQRISLFLFCCLILSCNQKETADLILVNGKILTLDDKNPQVTALASKGGRILALGGDKHIQQYKWDKTKIIDLKGQLAIPGLIEGHGHYMSLGRTLMQLDLSKAKSWEEIVDLVKIEKLLLHYTKLKKRK